MKTNLFISIPSTAVLILGASLAHADILTLKDDDRLSGTVLSIIDDTITLKSATTDTPFQIREDALKTVRFSRSPAPKHTYSELLTLKNGDIIPCSLLSLDDSALKIDTSFSESLHVPRSSISTLKFGISAPKTIFKDDLNLTSWEIIQGKWNVVSDDSDSDPQKKYECSGPGHISRKIDTTGNINISYDLEWDTSVNFTFRFCAANNGVTNKQNSYQLVANHSGIQISRYQSETLPIKNLCSSSTNINKLKGKKIRFSINLNRDSGEISAMANDEFIGSTYDTSDPAQGQHFTFSIGNHSSNQCLISNFKITALPSGKNARPRLDKPTGVSDILIDNEADEISGSIDTIQQSAGDNEKLVIGFRADKSGGGSIQIPEHRISTLYFGTPEDEDEPPAMLFKASTTDSGSIQFSEIKLIDHKVTGIHPDLGRCEIDTKQLSSLEYQPAAIK